MEAEEQGDLSRRIGVEGWLSGEEHLVLFWRTRVEIMALVSKSS